VIDVPTTKMSVVAQFPEHYFVENLAVRADNSLLVTVGNRNELYYIPTPRSTGLIEPQPRRARPHGLLHFRRGNEGTAQRRDRAAGKSAAR